MEDNRPAFFQDINPPAGLLSVILARIAHERRRAARLRLAAFGTVAFVSLLMLIPAAQYAASEFYTSGFYDYALVSLDGLSRGYWRELLYSLAYSLPSLALLLLASVGVALAWSARRARQHMRIAFPGFALSA